MGAQSQKHSLLRVNHAGERGAVAIYKGQLAALGHTPVAPQLEHMLAQEQEHLTTFDALLNEHKARPSLLDPLWQVGGFAMGFISGVLGPKAAMACTAAVEEVIVDHYQKQMGALDPDDPLRPVVTQFCADEEAHRQEALDSGAMEMSGFSLFTGIIKTITKTAIGVAKRV